MIFIPPLLFGANWLTFMTWLWLVEWDGTHTHSGFDFLPGIIPGPQRHCRRLGSPCTSFFTTYFANKTP